MYICIVTDVHKKNGHNSNAHRIDKVTNLYLLAHEPIYTHAPSRHMQLHTLIKKTRSHMHTGNDIRSLHIFESANLLKYLRVNEFELKRSENKSNMH